MVLLVLWSWCLWPPSPFSLLEQPLWRAFSCWSGKQATGEEEAHWHSISALSFSCCWRRIWDTICGKSRLKSKCDVWGRQPTMWSWAQSSALFSVCPKILSYGSSCHVCADDSQVFFATLYPCVLLPLRIPLQFVKGRSSFAFSERLLSFLSKSALLSFFFLGKSSSVFQLRWPNIWALSVTSFFLSHFTSSQTSNPVSSTVAICLESDHFSSPHVYPSPNCLLLSLLLQ